MRSCKSWKITKSTGITTNPKKVPISCPTAAPVATERLPAAPTPVANTNLCDDYYIAYKNAGRLKSPSEYTPKVGDTIFFYGSGGYSRKYTNHVGIVTGTSGSGESIQIHTIEGNANNRVASRTYGKYRSSWSRIVGYGVN